MNRTRRCLVACLSVVAVVVFWPDATAASSWSSSRHRRSQSSQQRRKKRTKRPPNIATKEGGGGSCLTDPHDGVSSSSPSFLPLVFSDDEREEHILSALARLELDGGYDEEEEDEKPQEERQQPTLKKSKRVVKKAIAGVKVEQDEKAKKTKEKKDEQIPVEDSTKESEVKASGEETLKVQPKKETPAPINDPSSLTVSTSDAFRNSPPRQSLLERPEYPPRPVWTRPTNQPLQSRPSPVAQTSPATHSSTSSRPMPTTGARTPPPTYPYAPPGTAIPRSPATGTRPQPGEQSSTTRWVRKFLSARPKDALLPIPREYLSDGFNLVQLAPIVERIGRMDGYVPPPAVPSTDSPFPVFKAALRLILSNDADEPTLPPVQRAAEVLYTLVHARYVISPRGLDTVRRVLRRPDGTFDPVFGRCPRMACRGMPVLPCGDSDTFDTSSSVLTRAKRYCPSCGEKFYKWDSKVHESAWGSSFCNLFLMIYGIEVFQDLSRIRVVDGRNATRADQTIFGFKIHPVSQLRYSVRDM